MQTLISTPTLEDGRQLFGAAARLLTDTASLDDLRTLQAYRNSNNREFANAARLALNLHGLEPAASNVVSITANQTRHDLAIAFRSMDAVKGYDPLETA